ncbi:hypothetical protein H2200_001209 [Cladophialophora chaetospira]|uniref:Uncharacterized protein n=1 Tax=Cladophialophora chaetospira TaxID=386627 RepID=A0AA38XKQ4_9EURO|nr:hypothetical protein H2200_001209 [Cladophialophora chaetospira]
MSGSFDDSPHIPLSNNTALNDEIVQQWIAGANTRGTADILYTCIVTIILCVWTCVHMNIPAPGEHPSRRVWRKIKWTIYGLLGPEIVLFTAWSQYNEAKDLIKYLNEQRAQHESEKSEAPEKPIHQPFNLRYGFFAVMGGLRVPTPALEEKESLISLTPGAIKALAYTGRFLPVDDKDVQDRSKADGLAKLLICVQVTWLSLECIARKVSHLPLTILEIHTFIHVVCALAIYLIWFKKPLDIKEATVVDLTTEDEELLSLLHLLGLLKGKQTFQVEDEDNSSTGPKWFNFVTVNSNEKLARKTMTDEDLDSKTILPAKLVKKDFEKKKSKKQKMEITRDFHVITGNEEVGLRVLTGIDYNIDEPAGKPLYELDWPDDITPVMRKQAYHALTRLNSDTDTDLSDFKISMANRAENFDEIHASWFSLIIQTMVLMAYGGVHLTAWNSHFPTKTEMWLWRSSALLLAGTTPALVGMAIPALGYMIIAAVSSSMGKFLRFWFYVLACLVGPALVAAYFFARCFLVIESFISLRSVPIGVYSAVPWSSYLPHI